jgi:hypothetical protein
MEMKYYAVIVTIALVAVIAFSGCLGNGNTTDNSNTSAVTPANEQGPANGNINTPSVNENASEPATAEVDSKLDSEIMNSSDDVVIGEMN